MKIIRNQNGVKLNTTGIVENLNHHFSNWWRQNMHRSAYLTDIDGMCYSYKTSRPGPVAFIETKQASWQYFGISSVEAGLSLAAYLEIPYIAVRILNDEVLEVAILREFMPKKEIVKYCEKNAKRITYNQFKNFIEKKIYKL